MIKAVVKMWRQEAREVGLSATAYLARFADPHLHVIKSLLTTVERYLPSW